MTTNERYARMYEHREADRIPVIDGPWPETIDRWVREGMPSRDHVAYFGLEKTVGIRADFSPRYESKILKETDTDKIYTTGWGATQRSFKRAASTPEFLGFTIIDRESWAGAKARMVPSKDRVDWKLLQDNYGNWKKEGYWISAYGFFGFDVTHSWVTGTERLLMALLEDPEWCYDIFNTCLDMNIAMFDMVWDAGYHFDELHWCDDMGYKGKQFFSLSVYRELVKPVHKRAIEWAHTKGVKTRLHSCGNIGVFIPELIEIGLDALNPLEVKSGMDPLAIKKQYGGDLVLHGGVNAVLYDDAEAIVEEIKRVVPEMKRGGGYIFSSDHSVPDSVSLENFRQIIEAAKKYGTY